jgi:hypothetical protein
MNFSLKTDNKKSIPPTPSVKYSSLLHITSNLVNRRAVMKILWSPFLKMEITKKPTGEPHYDLKPTTFDNLSL